MQKDINTRTGSKELMSLLAIAVFGFAASAFIPLSLSIDYSVAGTAPFGAIPLLLVIIGFSLCYTLTRSVRPLVTFIIIAIFTFAFPGTSAAPAIIPLCYLSVALLAYFCRTKSPLWLLLPAGAAYALSFVMTWDPVISAAALIPSIAAFVLFYSYKKDAMRVSSVLCMSLVFGIGAIAIFIAQYLLLGGKLDIKTLSTIFTHFREFIIDETANILYTTYDQVQTGLLSAADARAIASEAVGVIFNFMPAIFVIVLFLLNYVTHSLFIATVIPAEPNKEKIKTALTFKMSFTSAVVFILAFLLSAALDYDGHGLYSVALANLYMILVPSFTVIAFGFVGAFVKGESASCLGYLVYISLFLLLFNRPDIVLPLASFAGALVVIITSISNRRKKEKENDGGNDATKKR